jgi:hypothetical protein
MPSQGAAYLFGAHMAVLTTLSATGDALEITSSSNAGRGCGDLNYPYRFPSGITAVPTRSSSAIVAYEVGVRMFVPHRAYQPYGKRMNSAGRQGH